MMILNVFVLFLPLISSAPIQLQYKQPLHSFTSSKKLADNNDGDISVKFDSNSDSKIEDTIFRKDNSEKSETENEKLLSKSPTEDGKINAEEPRAMVLNIPEVKISDEMPSEFDATRYEEVPLEMSNPEVPLHNWPLVSIQKIERQLKQDQVQHQMFKPFHNFMNTNVQKPKPMQPEMPIQMQQMSMMNKEMMKQQILALHRLQALQNFNAMNMPQMPLYPPQPLLVLLPMKMKDIEEGITNTKDELKSETNAEHKTDYPYENTDPESVIIEAGNFKNDEAVRDTPQRTILLFPNIRSRFSLGDIISAIPWLPFEVNVPDTIAWAYNGISSGISGIISIIGQWPFSRPSSKSGIQNMMMKPMQEPMTPIVMMVPMNPQMIQLPIIV